ncbi:MAG: hypothetical protein KAG91_00105 [Mycoplasmataceae bacterium]|nr:hypothetical protein [Mycoplasmataceae bacterium]
MARDKTKKSDDIVAEAQMMEKFETYMLPPQFRRRSAWQQKLKFILFAFAYSIALGLVVYSITGGLKENFHVVTNTETFYFLASIMLPAVLMFVAAGFIWWAKSRQFVLSWFELIIFLTPALIISAGFIYLKTLTGSDLHELFKWISYISLAAGGTTVILTMILTLFKLRTYREMKFRVMYTIPGMIIASVAPYILTIMTDGKVMADIDIYPLLISVAAFAGGILFLALGVLMSAKYILLPEKNIWNSIKFNAGLPMIVIFSMLIALSAANIDKIGLMSVLYIQIGVQITILIAFSLFLWFNARIKNMNTTNPLFNEGVLKVYLILQMVTTLVLVYMMPTMTEQKGYGVLSFELLAVGSFFALMGIVFAHFTNLIVYVKYNKTSLAGVVTIVALIYAVALSIASLQQAEIISQIIGRQLVLTYIIIALIFLLGALAVNVVFAFIGTMQKKKKEQTSSKAKVDKIKKGGK